MSMAADGDDATGADFENDRSLNQILSVLDNDMTQHRERLEESLAKATDNAHRCLFEIPFTTVLHLMALFFITNLMCMSFF